MSKLENVVRVEEKYIISNSKKIELLEKLKENLIYDENSIDGKYSVRTLYFDTPNCQDYQDKVNEKLQRKGIRMRVYNVNDNSAKIELKRKDNSIQNKISLTISKDDAKQLLKQDYECLKNYNSEIALQLYDTLKSNCYAPKTLILYDRYAFECPNTKLRVTIDSNLTTSNLEFDLWSMNIETIPVGKTDEHILEVKKIGELPDEIKNILYPLDVTKTPSSKYKRCCKFLSL